MTREALLTAGRELVAKRGVEVVTLEEIARAAGLTIGAVYSNFTGKAELMWAILDDTATKSAGIVPTLPGRSLVETLSDVGRWVARLADESPDYCQLTVEFLLYALRTDGYRRTRLPPRAEGYEQLGTYLSALAASEGRPLPMSPRQYAEVVGMVAWSLMQSRMLLGRDLITEDVIVATLTMLAPPATPPTATPPTATPSTATLLTTTEELI